MTRQFMNVVVLWVESAQIQRLEPLAGEAGVPYCGESVGSFDTGKDVTSGVGAVVMTCEITSRQILSISGKAPSYSYE